jgi:ppGpp synthetase/RelA/SpoT-type nucleotidyltranferase
MMTTFGCSARPLKTPEAIVAKLVREKARLNKIQDIAGARVVVPDRPVQDAALGAIMDSLKGLGPKVAKDTRETPDEHGYRAIHIVVTPDHPGIGARPAEIQVRTRLQNMWAQVVERLDGVLQSDLKHGNGPADFQEYLLKLSAVVGATERGEPTTIEIPDLPALPEPTL